MQTDTKSQTASSPANGRADLQVVERLPERNPSAFSSAVAFESAQRMARLLSESALIPDTFRGKLPDCVIALELAGRIGASPLAVMQNLYLVHGKPGWSAQFLIACVNACGRFTPLRYVMAGTGDDWGCIAWAKDSTGERLEGPRVTIKMAKDEGWYAKNGSKWKSMPDLMLRYRAATFFQRTYAPELSMGIKSEDEIVDIGPEAEPRMPKFEPAEAKPEVQELSPQAALCAFLVAAGVSFDDFRRWMISTGRVLASVGDGWQSWNDVSDLDCDALKADSKGLAKCVTLYGKKEEAK